jgi:hypothetical protein
MSNLPRKSSREAIRAVISASSGPGSETTYINDGNEKPASADSDLSRYASVDVVVDANNGKDDSDSSDYSQLETVNCELVGCDCQTTGQLMLPKEVDLAYNR